MSCCVCVCVWSAILFLLALCIVMWCCLGPVHIPPSLLLLSYFQYSYAKKIGLFHTKHNRYWTETIMENILSLWIKLNNQHVPKCTVWVHLLGWGSRNKMVANIAISKPLFGWLAGNCNCLQPFHSATPIPNGELRRYTILIQSKFEYNIFYLEKLVSIFHNESEMLPRQNVKYSRGACIGRGSIFKPLLLPALL